MNGPGRFGPPDPRDQGNPFGSPIGGRIMYPDTNGDLHSSLNEALDANLRIEDSIGRGLTGGCGQDSSNLPKDSREG